jgi:hypothetical protein
MTLTKNKKLTADKRKNSKQTIKLQPLHKTDTNMASLTALESPHCDFLTEQEIIWQNTLRTLPTNEQLLTTSIQTDSRHGDTSIPHINNTLAALYLELHQLRLCPLDKLNPHIHHDLLKVVAHAYTTTVHITTAQYLDIETWTLICEDVLTWFKTPRNFHNAIFLHDTFIQAILQPDYIPNNLLFNAQKQKSAQVADSILASVMLTILPFVTRCLPPDFTEQDIQEARQAILEPDRLRATTCQDIASSGEFEKKAPELFELARKHGKKFTNLYYHPLNFQGHWNDIPEAQKKKDTSKNRMKIFSMQPTATKAGGIYTNHSDCAAHAKTRTLGKIFQTVIFMMVR